MITVSVLLLVTGGCLITFLGFCGGATSTAKAHHRELQWLIREQRITASQVRHINHLLDMPITDPDEEPQPGPSWPLRVKARALGWWERTRPTAVVLESRTPEDEGNEPYDFAEDADACDCEGGIRHLDDCPAYVPDPEPDTDEIPAAPVTQPDLRKASAVAPPELHWTADEEWARDRDRMLAEFRADMDKIQEGAK